MEFNYYIESPLPIYSVASVNYKGKVCFYVAHGPSQMTPIQFRVKYLEPRGIAPFNEHAKKKKKEAKGFSLV